MAEGTTTRSVAMACRFVRACLKRHVPIPTLKIWNQALGASHYRTACSRENDHAFDPPIDASGLELGFCTALVPPRGRTLFSRVLLQIVFFNSGPAREEWRSEIAARIVGTRVTPFLHQCFKLAVVPVR